MEKLIVGTAIIVYFTLVLSLLTGKVPFEPRPKKSCMTCKFDNEYLQDTPCLYCKKHNKWEKK